jgi:drug/metabolite transporter (DMT)-like permease
MRWTFDNFTKLVGLLSFGLIAAATLHDWGYFYVIGPKFRSIQTTYDYITEAIEWLPGFLFIIIISVGITAIVAFFTRTRAVEGFERQDRSISRQRIAIIAFASFGACFVAFWFIGSLYSVYPFNLTTVILAMGFLLMLVCVVAFLVREESWSIALLIAVIGSGTTILANGIQDGINDVQRISNVHRVQLKGAAATQVMLLRNFEKGVLVKNPADNQVEFIRWDQIDKLGRRIDIAIEPSGCHLFGFFCRQIILP